jgi:hypothetical protein
MDLSLVYMSLTACPNKIKKPQMSLRSTQELQEIKRNKETVEVFLATLCDYTK